MKSPMHIDNARSVLGLWLDSADGDKCYAVVLAKESTGFKLLKKAVVTNDSLKTFARENLAGESISTSVLSAALPSTAFYRLRVPPLDSNQLDSVIRIQAESILPLPLEQMQFAFRADEIADNGRRVTIAAAKTEHLRSVVTTARSIKASAVCLDHLAVVAGCKHLLNVDCDNSVLIDIQEITAHVLLIEDGVLKHAITLDIGSADLAGELSSLEMFCHDFTSALELFEVEPDTKVIVLSPAYDTYGDLINCLCDSGITAQPGVIQIDRINSDDTMTNEEAFLWLKPLGTAMAALNGHAGQLNIFEKLYDPDHAESARPKVSSIKRSSVIAVIMLCVFLFVSYTMDKLTLSRLSDANLAKIIDRQKTIKMVADQRPDILALLTKVQQACPEGLMLDGVDFKKGQPVVISSHTNNRDKMFEFEKKLGEQINISDVKIQSQNFQEKTKQIDFRISFHYGKFTGADKSL